MDQPTQPMNMIWPDGLGRAAQFATSTQHSGYLLLLKKNIPYVDAPYKVTEDGLKNNWVKTHIHT